MLNARGISFAYVRHRPVLNQLSIDCAAGIHVIVGPNAAGKTTLLRLLAGLLFPQAGAITINGRSLSELSPANRARHIAYVAQRPTMSAGFTAREVVSLGRFAHTRHGTDIDDAMQQTETTSLADTPFAHLSTGQQQRVSLARALAQIGSAPSDTKILLADEPLAAMDPEHRLATCELLRERARQGVAVVLVVHDLTTARRIADRASVLTSDGRLAATGTADHVLTPTLLERVFRVRFTAAETRGGPTLTAESRVTSAP